MRLSISFRLFARATGSSILLFIAPCLFFACVAADGADGGPDFLPRRAAMVSVHPLYGRTIQREELPALLAMVRAAQALPPGPRMTVAYLIQGEEDTSDKERSMWASSSDAFVLTFRSFRSTALFFPNSRLAEGRNVLLAAAALEELRRGTRYTYYVFMDADCFASTSWTRALFRFEAFLREWEPAVGLPACADAPAATSSGSGSTPIAVTLFDHIFEAVHWQAAAALLPYRTELDQLCAWVSQWHFTLLASALFRNHTLMLPSVVVHNPAHSGYPKRDCWMEYKAASERLREGSPEAAKSCFPDPSVRGFIFTHGKLGPTSYLPWGTARRKQNIEPPLDYSRTTLEGVPPCNEEVAAVLQRTNSRSGRFCEGCPPNVVLYALQTMVSQNPVWPAYWHELGMNAWGVLGDVPVAAVCVAIARRLLQLRKMPAEEEVERMANFLDAEFIQLGYQPLDSGWLFREGAGRRQLEALIPVALLSSHYKDADDPVLVTEAMVTWLVDVLLGEVTRLGQRPAVKQLGAWAQVPGER